MKTIDTRQYLALLEELSANNETVGVPVSGFSMNPFLANERDQVFFQYPDRPLKRGDIVFFKRNNGQYVLHRIWKAAPEGYYIVGDAQTQIEGPIDRDQIFGLVTQVRRKGKLIGPRNFWWQFFAKVWIRMVPVRPAVMRLYAGLYRRGK